MGLLTLTLLLGASEVFAKKPQKPLPELQEPLPPEEPPPPNYCGDLSVGAITPPDGADLAEITSVRSLEYFITSLEAPVVIQHCEVRGIIDADQSDIGTPEFPSVIHFVVRLPVAWNGKFMMGTDGGFAGDEDSDLMLTLGDQFFAHSIYRGYVTATSDYGHKVEDINWGVDRRPGEEIGMDNEREINWAYRAVHLTTLTAKDLIEDLYGVRPFYSYIAGCSNGGRGGFMAAKNYPNDYDGMLLGAPTLTYGSAFGQFLVANAIKFGMNITKPKLGLITEIVLEKCDALDGVVDGIINDPKACNSEYYNPERDLPRCIDDKPMENCFTNAEISQVAYIYRGIESGLAQPVNGLHRLTDAHTVSSERPGDHFGIEDFISWQGFKVGDFDPIPEPEEAIFTTVGNFILDTLDFKLSDSNEYYADLSKEEMSTVLGAAYVEAVPDADIGEYLNSGGTYDQGGRILVWHGWLDPSVSPQNSIDYFDNLKHEVGEELVDQNMRLFMLPGTGHCLGGTGPQIFDGIGALETWVEGEDHIAPEVLLAFNGPALVPPPDPFPPEIAPWIPIVRFLCRYPKVVDPSGFFCYEPVYPE